MKNFMERHNIDGEDLTIFAVVTVICLGVIALCMV